MKAPMVCEKKASNRFVRLLTLLANMAPTRKRTNIEITCNTTIDRQSQKAAAYAGQWQLQSDLFGSIDIQ